MQQTERLPEGRGQRGARLPERAAHGPFDLPFVLLVVLISAVGLVMMFSASYASAHRYQQSATHFFFRQGLFLLLGLAAMYLISQFNYQYLRALSIPIMVTAMVLLVLVLFIGTKLNGARRWIYIGEAFNFQPSEIAKIAVIILFSAMICTYGERMKKFRHGILPFVLILGAIAGLMLLEPHISGTVLILGVGAVLMFAGGANWRWFAAALAAGAGGAYVVLTTMSHAITRIAIWQDPFSDAGDTGYQIVQSLYAVGSGGLFGLGLGKSRQKYLYLPEQHNDFVFAIVCEELGLVGAIIILLLFMALILRGYWIAVHARDRFGSLLVTGITTLLALQTFLNMAVVTNLIPVTGVSMPFFSYGGTSLLIQLAEMGIVLAVSRQIPAPKSG